MAMKIYALDSASGIAIVYNNDVFAALVNGKLYSVRNYRPLNGDGRQLRADSQAIINKLLDEAKAAHEADKEPEKAVEVVEVEKTGKLESALLEMVANVASADVAKKAENDVYTNVYNKLISDFGYVKQVHEFHIPEKEPREVTGKLRKDFDEILNIVLCNESLYFVGPAGTGKSFLAKQIADAMGLEFYYTNSVTDDIQLKGFIDANGNYHETQFYQAFTKGGIFLLDELDASVPEALILLNNALANGYFDFPVGRVTASENFHAIAAGNTTGTGATLEYSGRYQLDAASLDRFTLVNIDYDMDVEMEIAGNDRELVEFAEDFRNACKKAGVTCLCTYRAIKRLRKFGEFMEKSNALKVGLIKGLAHDDIQYIYQKMDCRTNSWTVALKEVC